MEQTNQSYLAAEKIGKLMGKYAIPCIISLLVGALYNIVDQIFIANTADLGSYGNAANTVVFLLTVISLAIAVMIGDGCCAFVSLSLGKNKSTDASRSMGNSILLTTAASVILTAIYLIFSNQIIAMFGGTVNAETFHYSKEFFGISLGIPFYWGMMGAAVATVIGQIVTAVLAIWYLCHTKVVKLSKEDFKLTAKIISQTLALGICSFLLPISLVAAMAAINNIIRKYGVGCDLRVGAIRTNSYGCRWYRYEVLPDRYFYRCRHGGRLYPDGRI